ncbi:MAG: hypothetical protein U0271_15010 [Polyangiaceae bacterium]
MSFDSHQFRAQRMNWKFRTAGGSGVFMRQYSELPTKTRNWIGTRIALNPHEIPVIGMRDSNDVWLIATTARLVWGCDGRSTELSYADLDGASPFREDSADATLANVESGRLVLRTVIGELSLQAEPGPPFVGLWAVLDMLARRPVPTEP